MLVKSTLITEKLERSSLVRPSSDFVRNNPDARFASQAQGRALSIKL